MVVFVAANRLAGGLVDQGQPFTRQRTRTAWTVEVGRRDGWTAAPGSAAAATEDRRFCASMLCSGRHRIRTARPVNHPGQSLGPIPGRPLTSGWRQDHEHRRRHSDRPEVLNDQPRQPKTSMREQSSIGVGHEGVRL